MFPAEDERNPYLQHEVHSASPVRLRWLLIRRAAELSAFVEQLWGSSEPEQADQWLLRIRDILGELLCGVTQGDDPLRSTVADLYIFLIQQVDRLQKNRDDVELKKFQEVLEIESETWRQVVDMHLEASLNPPGIEEPITEIRGHRSPNTTAETILGSLSVEA